MKLSDLQKYNDIVIQCHDNPDADALASGYGLYWYFTNIGYAGRRGTDERPGQKNVKFIYRGKKAITKSNLRIMLEELDIPVDYAPDYDEVPELLITVDCQYGQRNVTETKAENIAVIDHHQMTANPPGRSEIRSHIGSCATIVWDMIRAEAVDNLDIRSNPKLATALYYGLFTDTGRLSELVHPLDKDMLDDIIPNEALIKKMNNSNISLEELTITGNAILNYKFDEKDGWLILKAEPCDSNILGVISDFALETEGLDICIAYYVSDSEVKFSVRSCTSEVHANELAECLADGIGGGGGHIYKAGGTIRPEKIPELSEGGLEETVDRLLVDRVDSYFEKSTIVYPGETDYDISGMTRYKKKRVEIGVVILPDIYPVGTKLEVRAFEGSVDITVSDTTYLMITLDDAPYPIEKDKFEKSYRFLGHPYKSEFEYEPRIRDAISGESCKVLKYAQAVESAGESYIYAKPVPEDTLVKVFTRWNKEKYYPGKPGDYIAVREDDLKDIYVIKNEMFDRLYEEATVK